MKKRSQRALFETSEPERDLFEKRLFEKGVKYVAGVDEVGRGCIAGPVLAAAVILPFPCDIEGLKDSKKLSPKKREILERVVLEKALSFSFGLVDSKEIDEINILNATLKAMEMAVESLSIKPDYILIDGNQPIKTKIPQITIPKGDDRSITVAAASILAKVKRDSMMAEFEEHYPCFSLGTHKGYGTAAHYKELEKNGPTPIHRLSFKGVKS